MQQIDFIDFSVYTFLFIYFPDINGCIGLMSVLRMYIIQDKKPSMYIVPCIEYYTRQIALIVYRAVVYKILYKTTSLMFTHFPLYFSC